MRILRTITEELWWEVAKKCSYATFYHTPIWKELAQRAFPQYRDETFGAVLPSGVRVVFPMISTQRYGLFQRLMSTFEYCYGGFIADGPVSPAEAKQIYAQMRSWRTLSFRFLENPLAPPLSEEARIGFAPIRDATHILELNADFDTIFSRFTKTQRRAYRRGKSLGVQTRLADSLDDYRDYFPAYRDAVARWGKDADYGYSWSLFEHCYELSRIYPEQIKLWLMIVDEQIVGGSLVFYWQQHATAWNGTAYREYMDYDVMPVSDTEIIRDAIERGFRYFDLGTSGFSEGVSDYKRRYGTVELPVDHWCYVSPLIGQARRVYRRMRSGIVSLSRTETSPNASA